MKNLISQILVWTLILSQASFGAGRIQGSDVKSLSEVGAVSSRLIPTDKIFDVTNLQQLSTSISGGAIGGSGGTGVNLISSSSGASTGAWAAYQNTAQSTPVTATGGTPFSTFAASADPTVIGPNNFLWTKGAANRQGEGFSYPFSVDPGYRTRALSIDFYYLIASGTYVSGDMSGYIVDVTNSTVIQPTGCSLIYVVGVAKQHCEFQTSSTGSSYRFVMHVASTSANAYSIRFDEFSISPNTYNSGASVSDWTDFTPTPVYGTGGATNVTYYGKMRRVGPQLEGQIEAVFSATPAAFSGISFPLPAGLTADTTRWAGTVTQDRIIGQSVIIDPGINTFPGYATWDAANSRVAWFSINTASTYGQAAGLNQNNIVTFGVGKTFVLNFSVPILGWGAAQVLSSDTSTNVVAAKAVGTPTGGLSAGAIVIFPTTSFDTTGSYSTTTGRYTVSTPGKFKIYGYINGGSSAVNLVVYKNGVASSDAAGITSSTNTGSFLSQVDCVASDVLDLRPGNASLVSFGTNGSINFERISGPAQIAASEKVYLQYTSNAGTALTANVTNIDFATKVVDSHGAWNGTTFTAPRPGMYTFLGMTQYTAANTAANELFINGVLKLGVDGQGNSVTHVINGAWYLNSGDTVNIRSSSSLTLSNSVAFHWLSITSQ